ncbi:MAG: type II toxin-antitoxin system VapC family toxin [Wenzhouxiangellaceae bacterium]
MIILDTNVLSALMQRVPESAVIDWLDAKAPDDIWLSSITLYEARYGLALLDDGKRKDLLQQQLNTLVRDDLDNRVAVFDVRAANRAAALAAERKRRGRIVDIRDTFIGGIAIANRATLATRNTRHFEDLPTPVVNPWDSD